MGGFSIAGKNLMFRIEMTIFQESIPKNRSKIAIEEARKKFRANNRQLDSREWIFECVGDNGNEVIVNATPKNGRTFILLSPEHFGQWYEIPKGEYYELGKAK